MTSRAAQGKAVQSAIRKAESAVRAVYPDAEIEAFVEDEMFFLTATVRDEEDSQSASHAYTLDSMQPAELASAAEDLSARVVEQLRVL